MRNDKGNKWKGWSSSPEREERERSDFYEALRESVYADVGPEKGEKMYSALRKFTTEVNTIADSHTVLTLAQLTPFLTAEGKKEIDLIRNLVRRSYIDLAGAIVGLLRGARDFLEEK